MERRELQSLTREELVARAERLGVARPRVLTQPELMDEILTRTTKNERDRARQRGWLGRARDLIAGVVERGLHLPEVARALRATPADGNWPTPPAPLPTITLAEIYAAQGHLDRAIAVLDEVLGREPDHAEARSLRDRFTEQARRPKTRTSRPPPVSAAPESEATTERLRPAESGRDAGLSGEVSAAPSAPVDTEAVTPRAAPARAENAPAPPLPERYDVDEIVAIAVDPTTVYVYWEVRPTTLSRARARRPGGALVVRVASVSPSWDGPLTDSRDIRVDPLFGDLFVRDLQPGADVRVSVGWLGPGLGLGGDARRPGGDAAEFEPFAVGVEISAPRALPREHVARTVARWSPDPHDGMAAAMAASPVVGATLSRMVRVFGGRDLTDTTAALGVSFAPQGGSLGTPGARSPVHAGGGAWVERSVPRYRGGASELGRAGERRGFGGASDLTRGGASDLTRS